MSGSLEGRLRLRLPGRGLSQPETAAGCALVASVAPSSRRSPGKGRCAAGSRARLGLGGGCGKTGAGLARCGVAATLLAQNLGERTPQFAAEGTVALLEGVGRTTDFNWQASYAISLRNLATQLDTAGVRDAAGTALGLISEAPDANAPLPSWPRRWSLLACPGWTRPGASRRRHPPGL